LLSYIHTQKAVYRERIRENWRERIIEKRESGTESEREKQTENRRDRSRHRESEREREADNTENQAQREKRKTRKLSWPHNHYFWFRKLPVLVSTWREGLISKIKPLSH
jgi:hypothetical protein